MRGLIVYGDATLKLVEDIPMPEITPYTALVKTIACGICNGTDTKLTAGHLNGFATYPAVLGHEAVGQVIQVGSKVSKYRVGDFVLRSGLGETEQYHSLWGGFAEYGRVLDYEAMVADGIPANLGDISQQVIPEGIDPVDATMLITVKEVYSALKRLGVKKGDKVAISGCGPVGLAMVKAAKLLGASFVALSGHHDWRIAIAKKQGADLAVNTRHENFAQAVKAVGQAPLDFYIDAVGRCDILSEALTLIKEDGVIGIYGIGIEENKGIKWNGGPYNFRIHSVQWPIPDREAAVHEEVMRFTQQGKIDLKDFVTHVLPIEEYEEGFRLVNNREGLKVVLKF